MQDTRPAIPTTTYPDEAAPAIPTQDQADLADAAAWIRAVAAALTAGGLVARLHKTRSGLDVTITAAHGGRKAAEIILDEEGYAELRWWTDLTAPPADAAGCMSRVLTAAAPPPPAPVPASTRP